MDLFKKYWYLNEARLKGFTLKGAKQDDYQQGFVSQAPVIKKIKK